ncbi:MAG TPA: hypothetical protein VF789_04865 [Thermoanaerobaculia bacterium]
MRNQRILILACILATLCAATAHAGDPFPPMSVPGIDHSYDQCLWRFNKFFDGNLTGEFLRGYTCPAWTAQSDTKIVFRVYSDAPNCDEEIPGVPPNMLLEAAGTTILRRDGLAHFIGKVQLKQVSPEVVFFEGTLELLGRVGTHQSLGEACNELEHIEGWIVARGVDKLSDLTLRATVALKATLPDGLAGEPGHNRITGVVLKASRDRLPVLQ